VIEGLQDCPTLIVALEGGFGGEKDALPSVIVIVFEAEPAAFEPVTVAEYVPGTAVGVPEITPVDGLMDRPEGSPVADQVVTFDPLTLKLAGEL